MPTYTGPGHASVYTGTTPMHHGIIGNNWYIRTTGDTVYCVGDATSKTIGAANFSRQYVATQIDYHNHN
ncbi:MAG: alkaline phosphatase family protein [Bacteroidetes bacterium]|nr:alkaline phosphatase family protein [Bacteroidota bacterium]